DLALKASRGSVPPGAALTVWQADTLLPLQWASSRWMPRNGGSMVLRLAPRPESSGLSSPGTSPAGPRYCPLALIEAGPPALRCRIEVILSLVCGAHCCQASIAALAEGHGHLTLKYVLRAGTGWVRNTNLVTIPKLPPPPPRSAQ